MTSLVLDLRSNPGGLIREGVQVASSSSSRAIPWPRRWAGRRALQGLSRRRSPAGWDGLRLALLVNRGTASSAELVAGALQDHDRAVIIGTPTYGKGVLQTTYPLGEEVAIKLTTARWFTPSGRTVQRLPLDTLAAQSFLDAAPAAPCLPQPTAAVPSRTPAASCPTSWCDRCLAPRASGSLTTALGEEMDRFRSTLLAYAAELRARAPWRTTRSPSPQTMRDSLYQRARGSGDPPRPGDVRQRRGLRGGAAGLRDRAGDVRDRVGAADARPESDRQLQTAVRVLRSARTQSDRPWRPRRPDRP